MSELHSGNRNYSSVDPREIDWPNLSQLVKVAQFIPFALVTGLGMFSAIAFLGADEFDWQPGMMTLIGLGCMLAAIPVSWIVPTTIISAQIRTELSSGNSAVPDPALYEKLGGFFVTRLIIGCALLEGAGFLNAIAFQMEKNPLSLAAVAVCIALILVKFPTTRQVQKWIAERLQG